MHQTSRWMLSVGLIAASDFALADTANGPDPYAPGFGFDTPDQAAWGGWSRGAPGTLYAEWDDFIDASHGAANDRIAAPDLGHAGLTDASLSWNAGTFRAGTGNLYNFSAAEVFQVTLSSALAAAPVRAVLQIEGWGTALEPASLLLNGLSPTSAAVTYSDPAYASNFGVVTLTQQVLIWELAAAPASYRFDFATAAPHLSLGQVAVDVAPVPAPPSIWLFGSALAGLSLRRFGER